MKNNMHDLTAADVIKCVHAAIDEASSIGELGRFREQLRKEIKYSIAREKIIKYGDIMGQIKVDDLS